VGVVHEPIQDGISQSVVTDSGVPLIDGQLADNHGRVSPVPVVHDFHQVVPVCRFQDFQAPVIQDEQLHFGQLI